MSEQCVGTCIVCIPDCPVHLARQAERAQEQGDAAAEGEKAPQMNTDAPELSVFICVHLWQIQRLIRTSVGNGTSPWHLGLPAVDLPCTGPYDTPFWR
jgi:hypothetical protein